MPRSLRHDHPQRGRASQSLSWEKAIPNRTQTLPTWLLSYPTLPPYSTAPGSLLLHLLRATSTSQTPEMWSTYMASLSGTPTPCTPTHSSPQTCAITGPEVHCSYCTASTGRRTTTAYDLPRPLADLVPYSRAYPALTQKWGRHEYSPRTRILMLNSDSKSCLASAGHNCPRSYRL